MNDSVFALVVPVRKGDNKEGWEGGTQVRLRFGELAVAAGLSP